MSKQTPIQFLRKKYFETGMLYETDFEKAEQMHKEQIQDSFSEGYFNYDFYQKCNGVNPSLNYYNETYGGQDDK